MRESEFCEDFNVSDAAGGFPLPHLFTRPNSLRKPKQIQKPKQNQTPSFDRPHTLPLPGETLPLPPDVQNSSQPFRHAVPFPAPPFLMPTDHPPLHCLITGGAGFIGSHLASKLLDDGHHVTIVDDYSTGNADNLRSIRGHDNLSLIEGSVEDESLVEAVVQEADRVYHLAAAVGVALIAKQPIQTIERNIYPTQLILDRLGERAERGESVGCFIASTSEVYGKNPKDRWNEEDDLVFGSTTRPRWSYGVSKAIDEFLALAFHKEKGLPVVVGRFFNVVGPRQTGAYGMVLPRFVEAARAGRPLVVHDDGEQVRCFAHVSDVVDAVCKLMDTPSAAGRVYNIGSDVPVSILQLAKTVQQRVNPNCQIEFQSYADAYDESFEDIRRRVPDLSRIRQTIGYEPTWDLSGIIDDIAASNSD